MTVPKWIEAHFTYPTKQERKSKTKTYFDKFNAKECELADDELDNVAGGGCLGYASVSIDGHYFKLVNNRTDSCNKFTCRACGGKRGNHRVECDFTERGLNDVCICCIHNGGHQLIGDYCRLQYR